MENYIYIILIVAAVGFLFNLWSGNDKNTASTPPPINPDNSQSGSSFPLKMQAYERLALFLERSKPQSLIMRLLGERNTVAELQILLLNTIRTEFEHNFSQQIYVSESLWQEISLTKDKLVQLINQAATEKKDTIKEFSEELLLQYTNEEDFIGKTLQMLRQEARSLQK